MKKEKILKYIGFTYLMIMTFNKKVFALRCTDLGEIKNDLQYFFNLIKIILPLLIIGLSIVDFISAISSKNERDLKKTFNKFVKRVVLAIVFFFLPLLINVALDLFMIDSTTCIN